MKTLHQNFRHRNEFPATAYITFKQSFVRQNLTADLPNLVNSNTTIRCGNASYSLFLSQLQYDQCTTRFT